MNTLTTVATILSIGYTLLAARREEVSLSYDAITAEKRREYLEGKTSNEFYIYPNQKDDAEKIIDGFYKRNKRIITVLKKTKVGANGLMVEIAKRMTTHPDDRFVVNPANVRILTGMSNSLWEEEMKADSPTCFKDKIFHHGQLKRADLKDMRDSLIIIDEIDAGTNEWSVLHTLLHDAGVLDVEHMKTHNNRFVVISASPIKQLYDTYRWGDLHEYHTMTIPKNYIGHYDFLERGTVQEFYSLTTKQNVEKWINEDIIDNYGNDFRVHIVRVTSKSVGIIQIVCAQNNIKFKNHNSEDRLTKEDENEFYVEPLTKHVVIAVKGLLRRANLIPNNHKLRIGATHELYTKKVDNNVQNQGLPGRMSGYWRDKIDEGHKIGPYRTSCKAIRECEEIYQNPFGKNDYQTNGHTQKKGKITSHTSTMLAPKNIENLEAIELPGVKDEEVDIKNYRIYSSMDIAKDVCTILYKKFNEVNMNSEGFAITSYKGPAGVMTLEDAVKHVPTCYGLKDGKRGQRNCRPCYVDKNDKSTIRFVITIHPGTDKAKIDECDAKFAHIPYKNTEVVDSSGISSSNSSSGKEECKNMICYSDGESVLADSPIYDTSQNNYSSESAQPAVSTTSLIKRRPKIIRPSE